MKKITIFIVLIVSALICCAPIMAAESNSDGILLGLFDSMSQNQLNIADLCVNKTVHKHVLSDNSEKSYNNYNLSFSIKDDLSGEYIVKYTCFDGNNTVNQSEFKVNSKGNFNIPLNNSSEITSINVLIYDSNNKLVYNNTTSNVKVTTDVVKDQPVKQDTSKDNSGTTYWGSSKSGKFHKTNCEWAQKIHGNNKVVFHSRDEAINKGYQPCNVCNP